MDYKKLKFKPKKKVFFKLKKSFLKKNISNI